jgi:hypothetical protein
MGAPTEAQLMAEAEYMAANLLQFGYNILTVDAGWSSSYDAYGRYTPDVKMYPSAGDGRGFRNISERIHALGLKFGELQCAGGRRHFWR